MSHAIRVSLLLMGAAIAGILCAEGLFRLPAFREQVGRVFGRGSLVALVKGVGVYESGSDEGDTRDLVIAENLRSASTSETAEAAAIQRESDLLCFQFPDENAFADAVSRSGLSEGDLRLQSAEHLRQRGWLEKQIAPALVTSEEESREFYEAHREEFKQPQRFRARHLFLAAHSATPAEVVEANRKGIAALAGRLAQGEDFAQLATVSEDEATKSIGGDLGFFTAERLPSEFMAEVEKLRVGQISAPFRSHLGFHIVQLIEVRPPGQLSFDDARAEIGSRLVDEKRAQSIEAVAERLHTAEFLRKHE